MSSGSKIPEAGEDSKRCLGPDVHVRNNRKTESRLAEKLPASRRLGPQRSRHSQRKKVLSSPNLHLPPPLPRNQSPRRNRTFVRRLWYIMPQPKVLCLKLLAGIYVIAEQREYST
jgi:hypothetical protein